MSKQSKQALIVFVAIIVVIIAVVLIINRNVQQKFKKNGIRTEASVVGVEYKSTTTRKKRKYVLRVSFFAKKKDSETPKEDTVVQDSSIAGRIKSSLGKIKINIGDLQFAEVTIPSSDRDRYRKGDKVAIYYLPDEPKKIILASTIE